jgi:4-alpha-glucanotransferase
MTSKVLTDMDALAAMVGVQTSYRDANDVIREAEPDVVLSLLRSLEVSIDRLNDAPRALRETQLAQARQILEPVVALRQGEERFTLVTLPERVDPQSVSFSLQREDGGVLNWKLSDVTAEPSSFALNGESFKRYPVLVNGPGHDELPLGYHNLFIEVSATSYEAKSLVICAPTCPAPKRGWGAFIPLHAVRTNDDWGIGSYSDLKTMGDWLRELGASMVGGLPLYPTFVDTPIDPSPYRPVSRLAYNELYIDPTGLPELGTSSAARDLLCSPDFLSRIASARASSLVDYEAVAKLRRGVLEPLSAALFAENSSRREEIRAFGDLHPELVAYATFRATHERSGYGSTSSEISEELRPAFNYHLYCQWIASTQLSAASGAVAQYADLPIGVHPEGFDPSWSPTSFLSNVNGGAPPDAFFSEGQDWGFPPLHPQRIREDGYSYVIATLRRVLRHSSFVRIDHVMGLQRLYMIPSGTDARHGAYVSYRADEMHALVSLEAARSGSAIIGEDLGTVPEGVRERMERDRMLRSWVFEFESTTDDPLAESPKEVLASLATHDMPRFATFLWGHDIDEAEKAKRISPEEANAQRSERALYRQSLFAALNVATLTDPHLTIETRRGCVAHMAASDAQLVLVDLEEIWGEIEPQNRPGTTDGNWRQRARLTLEEIQANNDVRQELGNVNRLRRKQAS